MPLQDVTVQERILFIAEIEAWGGAERSFLALCHWLHERSLSYRLLVYWDRVGIEKFAEFPLVKTELLPQENPRSKIAALRAFFAARASGSFKPLTSGYQPALHATLAGQRGFHCFMHDTESFFDDWDLKKPWRRKAQLAINRRLLHRGLSSGGTTMVSSEFLKRDAKELYGIEPVIARIGTSQDDIVFRPRHVQGQLRMLSVARVEMNKRIHWILSALATLQQQQPSLSSQIDWHLDIVGKGAQREELEVLSRSLGLSDRVEFKGFVPDQELARLYEQTDLFLMPARQGYGIPALEALHRGIPVLLHRESGISDILLNTPWAQVFEGGPENLAPSLKRMIASLTAGKHLHVPLPPLPTQKEWAEQVAGICGWVD